MTIGRVCRSLKLHHQRMTSGYAANSRRTAAEINCSASNVNREPLMRPIRFKVRSVTGSQSSAENPTDSIARARCSSASRSVHEISSIVSPGSLMPRQDDGPKKLKID